MKCSRPIGLFGGSVLAVLLLAANVSAGATFKVNSTSFGANCDQQLSLEEARDLAALTVYTRPLTNGEKNQIVGATFALTPGPPLCDVGSSGWAIVGNAGLDFADDIIFVTDAIGVLSGGITLGKNDDIDGLKPNGTRVILDGSGVSHINGIQFATDSSGSQVRNLEIRDFSGSGILASAPLGAIFEGLMIYNNALHGIQIIPDDTQNARDIRIGGPNLQHRNFIYSNGQDGIYIRALANIDRGLQNIRIENNYIGTFDGTTDQGNGSDGIYLEHALGVTIGDPTGTTRNVISGNNNDGIKVSHTKSAANLIVGNFIGTNAAGNAALGNSLSGVSFINGAGWNDNVGGAPNEVGRPGLGNVISGNDTGIYFGDSLTSRTIVKGNKIGTNLSGNLDLGNANNGITIASGPLNVEIGGSSAGDANEIAFNNNNGIAHGGGQGFLIRRNSIYSNDNLGIDLMPAGATPNDNLDVDGGPNNLQNYPIITFVRALSNSVTIQGTLNSAANQTYTIDLYGNPFADTSGNGEGRTWLGSQQVTTNGSGNATFNVSITVPIASVGQWVSATATDSSNNTSEFSSSKHICSTPNASPTSYLAPLAGASSNFTFITSTGCSAPTVASNRTWITGVSYSAGTVNFTVAPNVGPPRDGAVVATFNNGTGTSTLDFNISQNNGCTYGMTTSQLTQSWINWQNNQISVTASDNACMWTASSNAPSWITITFVDGSGNGAVVFDITTNLGGPRVGTITVGQMTFTVYQAPKGAPYDFNGDARADIGIFRPNGVQGAEWWITNSTTGAVWASTFGTASDKPVPGDYTGDQKWDAAFWSPTTGQWNILRSENFTYYAFPFGTTGDVPVPADYDGDFKADAAVFRPSTATWYIFQSSNGATTIQQFGGAGDKPVPADYDRDGRADIAIYRPSVGQWWLNRSSAGVVATTFGSSNDKPVPGDYTGDLRADIAFWRPSTGEWFVLRSEDFSYYSFGWGTVNDVPAPGDYDRDGRFDAAVFRPSSATWYVSRSTAGPLIQQFGASSDRPVENSFVP